MTDDETTRALAKAALDRFETSIMMAIADQPDGPARAIALKTLAELHAKRSVDPVSALEPTVAAEPEDPES